MESAEPRSHTSHGGDDWRARSCCVGPSGALGERTTSSAARGVGPGVPGAPGVPVLLRATKHTFWRRPYPRAVRIVAGQYLETLTVPRAGSDVAVAPVTNHWALDDVLEARAEGLEVHVVLPGGVLKQRTILQVVTGSEAEASELASALCRRTFEP